MGLFGPTGVDPSEIQRLQLARDQKTEADRLFDENLHLSSLEGVHPWHTSDAKLLNMARASIAFATDRTAELLVEEALQFTRFRRKPVMPPDAAYFARGLSEVARNRIQNVERLQFQQDSSHDSDETAFNEETITTLAAENQVPYWPITHEHAPVQYWQHSEAGTVSGLFLHGIMRAARELEGHAAHNLNRMCGPNKEVIAPVPPEYAFMFDVVHDNILTSGDRALRSAEGLMPADRSLPDKGALPDIYHNLHEGYISVMTGYLAVACPPSLGPDFLPQRQVG